jgi:hypothetical protein
MREVYLILKQIVSIIVTSTNEYLKYVDQIIDVFIKQVQENESSYPTNRESNG